MRVLITGSRTWDDFEFIWEKLASVNSWAGDEAITLVSGAAEGADILCEVAARRLGWTVERHPADWKTHGKRAGFIRNSEMVKLGADVCLAFIHNDSRGASMTVDLAEKAGIPTKVWRRDG